MSTETKMQYILDENGELAEITKDKCKPVEYPINYKLKNAFEVFVRVDGTENYWISNYGRCVNNYLSVKNSKKDNSNGYKFYEHKQGKCHYTIFEIEKDGSAWKRETSPEDLVVDTFLVKYKGRFKVWHKDGDESNNWYKNLLTVSPQDYKDLKAGKVTWQELNLEQEYIEYENKASSHAYKVYDGILARCKDTVDNKNVRDCYNKSTMWQKWLDDPKEFVKWYLNHYYECDGEEMDVDKDLFGDGSGMYHEDFCCILPKGLNTLLANSKKHYEEGQTPENSLPLGVRYNSKTNKYYGEIQFTGTDRQISLSEWDTPEEAFAEYKMMKQADILMVVAKYKESIPDYIYDKFLTVEVKPY
ncbi:MAG: hypothetical protein MR384_06760 [Lachnospiraceae bacterium]|nr:hypothetical protein [Lachnospiraceae bacterium]